MKGAAKGDHVAAQVLTTPIGELLVAATSVGVRAVSFIGPGGSEAGFAELRARLGQPVVEESTVVHARLRRELDGYFSGRRRAFTIPLHICGTPFQRRVWEMLSAIPYGRTMAYSELAATLGRTSATRAVANACARNPLPVLIPCHRAVAVDGSLGGYLGGLAAKRRLLAIERSEAADLPLFRVAAPPTAPTGLRDSLPERLVRWLTGHPRAARLTAEAWLCEALEVVPAHLWPDLAEHALDSGHAADKHVATELLDAYAAEVPSLPLDAAALSRFTVLTARLALPAFEVVLRSLPQLPGFDAPVRRAVARALERVMAGDAPAGRRQRELAVELWLALDPVRHEALLASRSEVLISHE